MANSTGLSLHRGSRIVTRNELESVPVPDATDSWVPLSHHSVLDRTLVALKDAGYAPSQVNMALSAKDTQFFGTIKLNNPIMPGVSLAVGIRNSIDKTLPQGFAAGNSVFVCDNLSFHSEIMVKRKHTRFGEARFSEAIALAVSKLAQFQEKETLRIAHFREVPMDDTTAESLILRGWEKDVISSHQLPTVLEHWRNPPFEDFREPTLWSLENAFTWALKELAKKNPQQFCARTIAMQGLLSLAADPQYAPIPVGESLAQAT